MSPVLQPPWPLQLFWPLQSCLFMAESDADLPAPLPEQPVMVRAVPATNPVMAAERISVLAVLFIVSPSLRFRLELSLPRFQAHLPETNNQCRHQAVKRRDPQCMPEFSGPLRAITYRNLHPAQGRQMRVMTRLPQQKQRCCHPRRDKTSNSFHKAICLAPDPSFKMLLFASAADLGAIGFNPASSEE